MQYVRRKVRVNTQRDSLLSKAMVADGKINLKGHNITTDSIDSADPNYSTPDGLYDPTKRKANGDIATNFDVVDESGINVGNAEIVGRVSTGAGARVNFGPNGKVGDAAWHAGSGNNGIQPGWISDDMNVDFPVVEPPFGTALPPTGDTVDGVTYDYILSSGNWMMSSGSFGGNFQFHYDENLARIGPLRGYVVTSWEEI